MRDYLNSIDTVQAIGPAAAITDNTALVGAIIDNVGYEGLVYVINLGSLADADATFAVTMDHGDASNLSDAAAVPAAAMTGTLALASFTFAEDNKTRKIGYVGSKRYTRLTITPTANSGNAFISAVALRMGGRFRPTANPPA